MSAPIHSSDEECRVSAGLTIPEYLEACEIAPTNWECPECHVVHGDPCPECGGHGFHREGCDQ